MDDDWRLFLKRTSSDPIAGLVFFLITERSVGARNIVCNDYSLIFIL